MHVISWHADVHTVMTLAALITIRAIRTNAILGFLDNQQIGKTILRPMFTLGDCIYHILCQDKEIPSVVLFIINRLDIHFPNR